jgi:hypothetical protein
VTRSSAAALVLAMLLAGCSSGEPERLGGTPETAPPSAGGPLPTVTPPSPEPTYGIAGDQPPADKPGAGPRTCPTDAQIVAAYEQHLKELGVTATGYRLGRRSPCADGWAAATLSEGEGLPPFVVVVAPNVRGKALAVVADGTDRDKGEPCAVAQRAAAPAPVLTFCRSVA